MIETVYNKMAARAVLRCKSNGNKRNVIRYNYEPNKTVVGMIDANGIYVYLQIGEYDDNNRRSNDHIRIFLCDRHYRTMRLMFKPHNKTIAPKLAYLCLKAYYEIKEYRQLEIEF